MTDAAPRRTRRRRLASATLIASVVVLVGVGVPAGALAFELGQTDSANRLDHPVVDLALLDAAGPDGAPRLLAIDAILPSPGTWRVALLQRDRSWIEEDSLDVDVRGTSTDDTGIPWLVGLSPTRIAVVATAPGNDTTQVVLLATDAGAGGAELEAIARATLPVAIDDAGAADVDGDGTPELVLGSARTVRQGGTCQGSTLFVRDGTTLASLGEVDVPETRLAGGVIGRFDDVPGDELLAYGHANCPAGPDTPDDVSLLTVRLADGTVVVRAVLSAATAPWLGSPLRLDVDGTGTHEALGQGPDGLSVLDPASGWAATPVSVRALPLVGGPDGIVEGDRIAWLATGADGLLGSLDVARDGDGSITTSAPVEFALRDVDEDRGGAVILQALADARQQAPSPAWLGALGDPACVDLIVPSARLACSDEAMTPGAAWIGTRPVTALGEGSRRRLLVAGGLAWSFEDGLPRTPTPWASGPAGWWRHGPSVPFSLAELRAGDATYFQDFPDPRASLMQTTEADASTIVPGFTGVRVFARVTPEAEDAVDTAADVQTTDPTAVLLQRRPTDLLTVLRIPVPSGLESGRDGSGVRLPLDDARFANGDHADRWSVGLVSVNDWGEIGEPVAGLIVRDAIGPFLTLEPPFTTPVWPFAAALPGTVEPGATVKVEGLGAIEPDRRGRFTIETPLAPWPQTLRMTATDPSGNETVRDISVIGGVDYRRFPWELIGAVVVLIAVGASGMVGSRWRRSTVGRPVAVATGRSARYDDVPMAEIEDLPPGGGLA